MKFRPRLEESNSLFEWYQESALAKIEPVSDYLAQLMSKNIKIICFCHHKQMMDGIEEVLAKMCINHIRIDGSTPNDLRQEACREFQTVAECRVALLSITACATGLNLTAASTVVFAELFWNPGILSQVLQNPCMDCSNRMYSCHSIGRRQSSPHRSEKRCQNLLFGGKKYDR